MPQSDTLNSVIDKLTKDIDKYTKESENLNELLTVDRLIPAEKVNIKYLLMDNKNMLNSYKDLYSSINKLEKYKIKKSYTKVVSSIDYICANIKSDVALELISAVKTDGKIIRSNHLEEFNTILKEVKQNINRAYYKDEVKKNFLTAINKYVVEKKKELDTPLSKYKHKVKDDIPNDKETASNIVVEIYNVIKFVELKHTIRKLESIRIKQEKIINKK